MKGVNLIDSSAQKRVDLSKIRKLLLKVAFVSGLVFIISSGVSLYFFWETGKTSARNMTKIMALENEIKKLSKNESYLITIDNRLTGIAKISQEKYSRAEIFNELKRISVPGWTLTSLETEIQNDILSLNGNCSDSQCLSNFNSKIEELVEDKKYSLANFLGVSRSQEGKYLLTIDLKK